MLIPHLYFPSVITVIATSHRLFVPQIILIQYAQLADTFCGFGSFFQVYGE